MNPYIESRVDSNKTMTDTDYTCKKGGYSTFLRIIDSYYIQLKSANWFGKYAGNKVSVVFDKQCYQGDGKPSKLNKFWKERTSYF